MKTKLLLVLTIAAVIFVSGCTGQPAPTDTNVTTPGGDDTSGDTDISGGTEACTSPYDGTYKGVIADSGDLEVTTYDSNDKVVSYTENPFTASYDFEMTLKCDYIMTDENLAETGRNFIVTHVKASHPIFDCANGCTPTDTALRPSFVEINNDGSGIIAISYPNGADFNALGANSLGYLQASPDAKTIDLHIYGGNKYQNIGSLVNKQTSQYIETYNCRQTGGPDVVCNVKNLFKNTITLTKVG